MKEPAEGAERRRATTPSIELETEDPNNEVDGRKMIMTEKMLKRPLLMTLSMWYFGLGTFVMTIGSYIGISEESMYINGILRNREYFIRHALVWCVAGAFLCAFISWVIKKGKWWFQPFPLIFWSVLLLVALIETPEDWLSTIFNFGIVAGFTGWYFYFKPNVKEYFQNLRGQVTFTTTDGGAQQRP